MMEIQDGNRWPRRIMTTPSEEAPGWATGLRQLYKVEAEQPMPSDFSDLLARIERKAGR